jgi:FkbM family methyltransferase
MFKIIGRLVYKLFKIEIRNKRNWRKDNKWLLDYDFETIIDIGANEGQFATKMRMFFPKAEIISFEPIPFVYQKLTNVFINDSKFKAYPLGLGDQDMETEFYENDYSPSSSLLKLKDHTSHFDAATNTKPIKITVKKLDEVLANEGLTKPIMVKIDVQGFEDKVIMGGKNILSQADLILCEVSFVQLYEGQKLFSDINNMLSSLGFSYSGNYEQLYSPATNEVLQADAIFIKKQAI